MRLTCQMNAYCLNFHQESWYFASKEETAINVDMLIKAVFCIHNTHYSHRLHHTFAADYDTEKFRIGSARWRRCLISSKLNNPRVSKVDYTPSTTIIAVVAELLKIMRCRLVIFHDNDWVAKWRLGWCLDALDYTHQKLFSYSNFQTS
jgi:hypothetical protein